MSDPELHETALPQAGEFETVPTSSEDVESAGRSCLVILVLAVVILLLLCVWVGIRSTAAG